MFESNGFRVLGEDNIDMSRHGGDESVEKSWVLMREPQELKSVKQREG